MTHGLFSENTKMADVALTDGHLLWVLPCLGIEPGFGEKTVGQVCAERGLSAPLVVLVCNLYTFDDYTPDGESLRTIPIEGIVEFLKRSHLDYTGVRMPRIISAVLALPGGEGLTSFCDKYRIEVEAHLRYEEEVVFPHIHSLLAGDRPEYSINQYASHHNNIDGALEDLKNIIVKYLPAECTIEHSRPVLGELFAFGHDLRKHCLLEDMILIPMVERLDNGGGPAASFDGVELSEREQQVLALLARGLANKEIADRLCISTHTVISHRKNIIRKTGFRTAQGLTFFALHSGLVSGEDFI